MSQPEITHDDLRRIEEKLDAIMDYFRIGMTPRRSVVDLRSEAKRAVNNFCLKNGKRSDK